MTFDLQIERLVPGAFVSKTQRTRVLTVQFPDRSRRSFTTQKEALAYVREYAKSGGHPVPPEPDAYLLGLAAFVKAQL